MNAFSDWAERLEAAADEMKSSLAITVAREQARDFLAIERAVTPKRTGHLADSETVDSVSGNGLSAEAVVSPHAIYAQFRNDGGTIRARNFPQLGNPTVGWFGKEVTQRGSHYVERSQAEAGPVLDAAAESVCARYFEAL